MYLVGKFCTYIDQLFISNLHLSDHLHIRMRSYYYVSLQQLNVELQALDFRGSHMDEYIIRMPALNLLYCLYSFANKKNRILQCN